MAGLNDSPLIHDVRDECRSADEIAVEGDEGVRDPFDALEVFELIRGIKDPEHPNSLEQLNVAQRTLIDVDDDRGRIRVRFTPTIPHCSMATLIGLCIRVKLIRSLPKRLKLDVEITPGTHASEASINKQLNDKERVAAALENDHLLKAPPPLRAQPSPALASRPRPCVDARAARTVAESERVPRALLTTRAATPPLKVHAQCDFDAVKRTYVRRAAPRPGFVPRDDSLFTKIAAKFS
jgi:metal-sulfur cluster biosynthetic enzyme